LRAALVGMVVAIGTSAMALAISSSLDAVAINELIDVVQDVGDARGDLGAICAALSPHG